MKPLYLSLTTILISCIISACSPSRQDFGTAAGGVVGGVAGSELTGGSTAGTIAGAVGGAYVGNQLSQ